MIKKHFKTYLKGNEKWKSDLDNTYVIIQKLEKRLKKVDTLTAWQIAELTDALVIQHERLRRLLIGYSEEDRMNYDE